MHLRADYGPLSIPNVTAEILFVKTGLILALFPTVILVRIKQSTMLEKSLKAIEHGIIIIFP